MKCRKIRRLLSPYWDGELDPRQKAEVAEHLDRCAACQDELAEIQRVSQAVASLGEVVPPASLWQTLTRTRPNATKAVAKVGKSLGWRQRFRSHRGRLAAVAIVVVLAAALLTWSPWHGGEGQVEDSAIAVYPFDLGLLLDELASQGSFRRFDARYLAEDVSWEEAVTKANFRVASLPQVLERFRRKKVRLLKNLCCNVVQLTYTDGEKEIFIFQQPRGHPYYFGRRPVKQVPVAGITCLEAESGGWRVVNWETKAGNFAVVGVMGKEDITRIIKHVSQ